MNNKNKCEHLVKCNSLRASVFGAPFPVESRKVAGRSTCLGRTELRAEEVGGAGTEAVSLVTRKVWSRSMETGGHGKSE